MQQPLLVPLLDNSQNSYPEIMQKRGLLSCSHTKTKKSQAQAVQLSRELAIDMMAVAWKPVELHND
ncbi:hypothetical protein A7K91_04285 [Paenibacillus oryzae]|uniref:Uncharacterized protein n=1 Tax=Paenibacillus oryzae TaxID=1844972 RepID=A0A1A5YHC8_9BACL|nr:hypothetical protein A7K91_04285 [Paenibacillus oryzae]